MTTNNGHRLTLCVYSDKTGGNRGQLNSPGVSDEHVNALKSISPRVSTDANDTQQPNVDVHEETKLPDQNNNNNNNIDSDLRGDTLPPPISAAKTFARKPSTRAWKFRSILDDLKSGLFEQPTKQQLDKLWTAVDVDGNQHLDRDEITEMIKQYVNLCSVVARKRMQLYQSLKKNPDTLSKLSGNWSKYASETQVFCNNNLNKLETDPKKVVNGLLRGLPSIDNKLGWTKVQFDKNMPIALERLKKELGMNKWADKSAELLKLQCSNAIDDEEIEDDSKSKKKRLEGILTIKVVGALDLKPEEGHDVCSPYCILHVGNKKLPTIFLQNTNNPEWSQKFRFTRYRFKMNQSRQGTLYVMDWFGEKQGASLVGFADFKIPDNYVEDSQEMNLVLKDNKEKTRGFLTITLSLQPKRPSYVSYGGDESDDEKGQKTVE